MSALRIRRARSDEATLLTDLALVSKAHWGYDEAFLEQCRPALTYTPEECSGWMYVAERDGVVAGLAQLLGSAPTGLLADLFVHPGAMGHGVGTALLRHVCEVARAAGFTALELDSDPHARAFYEHHGARHIRDVPSDAVPGRTLPRLRLEL